MGKEYLATCLRFPDERLASFTCSFGAADVSSYRIIGTRGDLRVEPAFEYSGQLAHHLTVKGRTALYRSAKSGKPVHVNGLPPARRPSLASEIHRPAVRRPALVHAMRPGGEEE